MAASGHYLMVDPELYVIFGLSTFFPGNAPAPTNKHEKKNELNPSATEFRLKRTAAEIAKWRLKDIAIEDDDDFFFFFSMEMNITH